MFAAPLIRKNLPGLLATARNDIEPSALYEAEFFRPRRSGIARIIGEARARNEIEIDDLDVDYICDLLLGTLFPALYFR